MKSRVTHHQYEFSLGMIHMYVFVHYMYEYGNSKGLKLARNFCEVWNFLKIWIRALCTAHSHLCLFTRHIPNLQCLFSIKSQEETSKWTKIFNWRKPLFKSVHFLKTLTTSDSKSWMWFIIWNPQGFRGRKSLGTFSYEDKATHMKIQSRATLNFTSLLI